MQHRQAGGKMTSGGGAASAALADSHVHLHAYGDSEIAAMLDRAADAGVTTVVAVSVDLESAARTLTLRHPRVRIVPAVGLHPGRIKGPVEDAEWAVLAELARRPDVGAIGECGLDPEGPADATIQLEALERHAALAAARRLPLLLHLRGPAALMGRALAIVADECARGVVHYFVGDRELAERYLAAGLSIALGKPVTRADQTSLREAVRDVIPLNRLLLETDTYPMPDRVTEPADVRLVANALAELKGLPLETVATATTANLEQLLGGG
jgi:TatD DNase family protein